jgi:AcrR family transcriptional regulator
MSQSTPYHHGNLREALLGAAQQVVESQGHQALSLREIAQELEVSRGAPYRHFADRDALLKAVAASGFTQLLDAHAGILEQYQDRQQRALESGRVFLAFTQAHPRLFMLMFDSGVLPTASDSDELGKQLKKTYETVGATVREAWPEAPDDEIRLALISMWSTLYGFARLRLDLSLKPYMYGDLSPQQAEDAVLHAAFAPLAGKPMVPAVH